MVDNWFFFPVKNNSSWYRVLNLILYKMCWIHYEDELCCELIAVLIKHMHAGCGWRAIPAGKITAFCFLPSTWLAPISAKSLIRIFKNQFDLSAWSGSFILGTYCIRPNFRLVVLKPLVLLCGILLYHPLALRRLATRRKIFNKENSNGANLKLIKLVYFRITERSLLERTI